MDTNVVVLVGNLTRDVEVRHLGTGTSVADVGLAVNRKVKDKEEVSFFDVVVWGRQAEVLAEYAEKGRKIAITGRLEQQTWEKDGQKRSKVVVVCENLQLLGGKGGKPAPAGDSFEKKSEEEVPY